MQTIPFKNIGRLARAGATFLLIAASAAVAADQPAKSSAARATVTITNVPSLGPGDETKVDDIAGKVTGVTKPSQFKIVLFAYGDKWYVQPWADSPYTEIDEEGNWEAKTHGGLEFAAALCKASYKPAASTATLPKVGGEVLAIVKVKPKKL